MESITEVTITFEDGSQHTYTGKGKVQGVSDVVRSKQDLRAGKPPLAFINLYLEVENDTGR